MDTLFYRQCRILAAIGSKDPNQVVAYASYLRPFAYFGGLDMPWLIGWKEPDSISLANQFFSTLGRALYLANSFEAKCGHILKAERIAAKFGELGDADAAVQLVAAMKDPMLADLFKELNKLYPITPENLDTLDKARVARNFVAHDGGRIGPLVDTSTKAIQEQLDALRPHVKDLAAGDNLVSLWEWGLVETWEEPPYGYFRYYPAAIEAWVFGGPSFFEAASPSYVAFKSEGA